MKKVIDAFSRLSIAWLIFFFIIASVNLSAPLLVSTVKNNEIMMEQIGAGLNEIKTDMVVKNGQLIAESEVVDSNSETGFIFWMKVKKIIIMFIFKGNLLK